MKFFSYLFSVLVVTAVLFSGIWYYYSSEFVHSISIHSPIPDFLMINKNNQVTLLDFWTPVVAKTQGSMGDLPDLTAQSVLMYDLADNKILYEKDPDVRH